MNRTETIRLLATLRSVFDDMVVTEETVDGWSWAFREMAYNLAQDAAGRYMQTNKFKPKPADILELIGVQQVAPNLIPEAAWTEVLKEARRVGYNRPPVFSGGKFWPAETRQFSSPLIEQAVEAVGWKAICLTPEEDRSYLQHRFTETLKALIKHEVRNVQTGETPVAAGAISAHSADALPAIGNGRRP